MALRVNKFDGINTTLSALVSPENQATNAYNVRLDNPYKALSNDVGSSKYNQSTSGNPVIALLQLKKHGYTNIDQSLFCLIGYSGNSSYIGYSGTWYYNFIDSFNDFVIQTMDNNALPNSKFGATSSGDIYCKGSHYISDGYSDLFKQTNGTGEFLAQNIVGGVISSNTWDWVTSGNNIYISEYGGKIYKQTNGTGSWVDQTGVNRSLCTLYAFDSGNIYAINQFPTGGGNAEIYKQTNGIGAFDPLLIPHASPTVVFEASNGDVYFSDDGGGEIYKSIGGGAWVSQTAGFFGYTRDYKEDLSGNIYVTKDFTSVYKQTSGIGSFSALAGLPAGTMRSWYITTQNDFYYSTNIEVYKQTNLTGSFVSFGLSPKYFNDFRENSNNDIYGISTGTNNIFKQTNSTGSFIQKNLGNISISEIVSLNLTISGAPLNKLYVITSGADSAIYKEV